MARILISLLILLVLQPRVALAETEELDSERTCNYIEDADSPAAPPQVSSAPAPGEIREQSLEDPQTDSEELAGALDPNQPAEVSADEENDLLDESRVALAGISIPSLWWAREQFDPFGGKLINNWLTNPKVKQIDLVVNWQLWTLLDYLGRYRFINQFGTVAREHGYDLRVFNQQKQCLALYEYNQITNPPKWEIKIEGFGKESLQVLPDIN